MDRLDRNISPAPLCLTREVSGEAYFLRKGKAWKIRYERDGNANAFNWGTYLYTNNSVHIVEALSPISLNHCFYCDANRLVYGIMRPEIDHFCPKTNRPFKAYYYPNLFLCCSTCNGYKLTKYNRKALLKFDDLDYAFDNFFFIDFDSGEIRVRPDIAWSDQLKARYTLLVLGINKDARPVTRRKELEQYSDAGNPQLDDYNYRFYIRRAI